MRQVMTQLAIVSLLTVTASPTIAQEVFTDEEAFAAAVGPLTLVNFDTDPYGNPLASAEVLREQYSSVGVRFEQFAFGDPHTEGVTASYPGCSQPFWLRPRNGGEGGGGFRLVFTGTVHYLGLKIVDLQDAATYGMSTLNLYDSQDNSIEMYNLQDEIGTSPVGILFFGVRTSAGIKSVEVTVGSNDMVAFDDLQFEETCSCPFQADLNGDGFIDAVDLAVVIDIVFFGALDVQDPDCPYTRADFNGDGFADAVDLAFLIDHVFFGGAGPSDPCAL